MKQGSVVGVALLIVLCAAGVSWVALRGYQAKPRVIAVALAEPDPAPAAAAAPRTGGVDALDPGLPEERVAAQAAVEAPTDPDAPSSHAEEGPELVLAGRFALYENGSPISVALNGSVSLTAWDGKRGRRMTLPVVDSRFEVGVIRTKEGVQVMAGTEVLRELDAEVEYFTLLAPEFDGYDDLQLRAEDASQDFLWKRRLEAGDLDATVELQRAGAAILEVVAEGSGEQLSEVDVYYLDRASDLLAHPKGQRAPLLASAATSPFPLRRTGRAATSKDAALLVGAPGFAWKKVKMDLSTSGERRVLLGPGGSLRVEHDGVIPPRARLRLYDGGLALAETWPRGQLTTFAGLTPGSYRASVELGDWFADPAVLGEAVVAISAGQETTVSLELKAPTAAVVAPLSGTLIVADDRDSPPGHYLRLTRITPSATGSVAHSSLRGNELPPIEGRDGHYSFEIPALETGTYTLSYAPLGWQQILDHPPEGTRDYVFEVPAPKDVTVRIVLAGTNETLTDVARILWHPKRPAKSRGGSSNAVSLNEETGLFHLQVPHGEFTVWLNQSGYSSRPSDFDSLANGEFVFEAQKNAVCKLELRNGGAPVPWPDEWSVELSDPTGEVRPAYLGSRGPERWFVVETAGSYTVRAPAVEGFLPAEPVNVDLVLGEERTLVIELMRE